MYFFLGLFSLGVRDRSWQNKCVPWSHESVYHSSGGSRWWTRRRESKGVTYTRTTRSDFTAAFHESVTSKHFLWLEWQQRSITGRWLSCRRTVSVCLVQSFICYLAAKVAVALNLPVYMSYEFWMRNEVYIGETTCWNLTKLSSVLWAIRLIELTT